jgi:drug/metabolite transporter (DMT)-like permease
MMADSSRKVLLWLCVGLLATSFPAILVRFADAPALAIAFYRNLFAAVIILPFIFVQKGGLRNYSGLMPKVVLTSFFLALHFFTWNASLKMTSVASSLVICSTQPIWSALLGRIFLKEKVTLRGWISIGIALSGIAAIAFTDLGKSRENLLGDLLALLAAIFASLYLILGRSVKDRIPLSSWLFAVYFGSCAFLFIGTVSTSTAIAGFSGRTWLMFLLMALVPSAIGHSLLNYAVRHIEAYKVQLGLLLEPLVSSILAFVVFMEKPSAVFYPGALLALIGVVLGISEKDHKEA